MSTRPPNQLESRLHQAALAASKQEITAKQAEAIIPDAKERQNALNFLLAVGLFKSLKNAKGQVLFRGVTKDEIVATKDLLGEESLILSHIKTSGNEGIWTKFLKTKTNLHQTILDRCIKTLTQKHLIKRVPSVQHPTRKIYMLQSLEPSIAMTGGPWYTDNELDTEFIQHLIDACYKFISDLSFPKLREGAEGSLYPISNAPRYPTAEQIRNTLKKARLTETELDVVHVEMLLNVLVLDGKIERIPAFGRALWDSTAIGDDPSDDEYRKRSHAKRKQRPDSEDEQPVKRKHKKSRPVSPDTAESSDGVSSRKKSKRKHRSKVLSGSDSESSSEEDERKRKKKKKKKKTYSSDSDDETSDVSTKKKKKKKEPLSDSSSSSASEAERRNRRKKSKSTRRSSSPAMLDLYDTGSGGSVYRAIKEERVSVGWSEAPCSQCPSFEFCKDEGPVNPRECVYYSEWISMGTVSTEVV